MKMFIIILALIMAGVVIYELSTPDFVKVNRHIVEMCSESEFCD